MEEDLLGPFKSYSRHRFTQCDRCGKPVPRSVARISSHGLQEDTLSEYEELCEQCAQPDSEDRRHGE